MYAALLAFQPLNRWPSPRSSARASSAIMCRVLGTHPLLPPAPHGFGIGPEAAGDLRPRQAGLLLEPLQPLREVLRKVVGHSAVVDALSRHGADPSHGPPQSLRGGMFKPSAAGRSGSSTGRARSGMAIPALLPAPPPAALVAQVEGAEPERQQERDAEQHGHAQHEYDDRFHELKHLPRPLLARGNGQQRATPFLPVCRLSGPALIAMPRRAGVNASWALAPSARVRHAARHECHHEEQQEPPQQPSRHAASLIRRRHYRNRGHHGC